MHRVTGGFVRLAVLAALLGLFAVAAPVSAARGDAGHNYIAIISSANEVPITDTGTYGWATFHINDDGQSISYVLWINAINNPIAAHIHLGGVGVNGPVVVTLYSSKSAGAVSGVLSSGTVTAADLSGPLKGMTMDKLFAAMKNGNAYTNVHTVKHPGGEARGQIRSSENGRLGS